MALASKGWVNRRLEETGGPAHPRRLEQQSSGSRGLTTDYVYVGGKRLAVPEKTSNYLKVYLDGTTSPEWVESMPETPDSNAEVFDVTKNRIHLPGNFAGG